ncbi:MAG: hypothetical protein FWD46_06345 [Cystobacterineae bacterium]|nr:hypothetical protein [Cystobacterineae bacterium]
MILAWFGFSQVFSYWASRGQADAEALALQTARAITAQLPVSPYASLANASALKQVVVGTGRVSSLSEVSKRLSALLEETSIWGAEDMALLAEKASGKTLWLVGKNWSEKAFGNSARQVIEDAARRREVVEMENGLKVFFPVEPPLGVESGMSLWIGGPVVPFGEAGLAQELKRSSALALGVVVSGKFIVQAGQSSPTRSLSLLNAAVANIQPGSAGMLKQGGGGGFLSVFWGTSAQLASSEVAARQAFSDKAELVVVLGTPATQEALLAAQQAVFYGWLAVFLVGVLLGFVVFPAKSKAASSEEETEEAEMAEKAFALPSSPPRAVGPSKEVTAPKTEEPFLETPLPALSESPRFLQAEPLQMSPELSKLLQPEQPPVLPPPEFLQAELSRVVHEPSIGFISMPDIEEAPIALGVRSEVEQLEEAWGETHASLPVEQPMPPAPALDFLSMPGTEEAPIALGVRSEVEQLEEAWGETHASLPVEQPMPPAPALDFLSMPGTEEAPIALGVRSEVEQLEEAWGETHASLPVEQSMPPAPALDFLSMPGTEEAPMALGLRGKAVQPEEVLGEDHAPFENPAAVFEATLREEAERFLGADFLSEPSSLAGEGVSLVEGPEMSEWRNVFVEFLRVRKQCNQETDNMDFERFKAKLEASKSSVLSKHPCKAVRFLVQIKDGKAAIKAIPVRE